MFDFPVVLAPDGGLALPDRTQASLSADELAHAIQEAGGRDQDIRVLAMSGEQNLPTLRALAKLLRRDIFVSPPGADLRLIPPTVPPRGVIDDRAADDADAYEIVPVDTGTGLPVDWLTIQPDENVRASVAWHELAGGLIVARSGIVALPLPDGGRMFASRETFVASRSAAAALRPGHRALTTVAIGNHLGRFELAYYEGDRRLVDGRELASALSSVPMYGAHVRLGFAWPAMDTERRELSDHIVELAESTGATIWVPSEPGRVEILEGCCDVASVAGDGTPLPWRAVGSGEHFETDVDGRLVPVGGIQTTSLPAVPLISGPTDRASELTRRFGHAPWSTAETFRCDLTVLADGRLGARYADGSLLAIGSGQFADLLRGAGWDGRTIELTSTVTPERAAGVRRHLAVLAADLGCAIEVAADQRWWGSTVHLTRRSFEHPPSGVGLGPADDADTPDITPMGYSEAPGDSTAPGDSRPPGDSSSASDAGAEPNSMFSAPEHPTNPVSRFIDGPRLMAAQPSPSHGLSWLPPQLQVNAEEFDLYVECADNPERAAAEGVPSPFLFVVGSLNRAQLAARATSTNLFLVRVAPGGAVDLSESDVTPPDAFATSLNHDDTYLLPAGWLDRVRVTAAFRVTDAGGIGASVRFSERPLSLRTTGAAHGVVGLPDEVTPWPNLRFRGSLIGYLVLDTTGVLEEPWLRVFLEKPVPQPGTYLLAVQIERAQAIDVAATAASLERFPRVRSAAPGLVADGVDVLLPRRAWDSSVVRGIWEGRATLWAPHPLPSDRSLGAWITSR